MLPDGTLAPRHELGSVLEPARAVEQALQLARSGRYDTICTHGDTPGAAQIVAAVRQAFATAGIATSRLAGRR
jgi:UPF0271 protein